MADVVMPQLGETVTEGTITKWLVQVGDTVEIDQPLFEVSTDKVDSEVPATASGVVSELVVPEGETVAVGVVVARVGDASSAPAPQPAPAPATPARRDESPASYSGTDIEPGSRDYVVPFTNIRRRTAEHMIHSKAVSAHTLMSIEVDFERVERVRRAAGAEFKAEEGFTLTYLPFIARAVVESVRAYPNVNASVMGDSLVVHRDINLSIAVDLNLEGLIAPVVHGADGKRLAGIAREVHDLATRARTRRLAADDIAGGTFTITNPGPFGTFMTGAIINQPQVAILATDGIARKPVVIVDGDGNESIGIHSVGMLTLNFDHRAIDGAYAAAFLAKLKQVLETRNWEQEL